MRVYENHQYNEIVIEKIIFPDSQAHIRVSNKPRNPVLVMGSIRTAQDLFELQLLSNALDERGIEKEDLYIGYLMGARYDRVMLPGDSFDLKVVANAINSCGFNKVRLLDVHSEIATLLINNSDSFRLPALYEAYTQPNAVLIVPDGGASKHTHKHLAALSNITDVVQCIKSRDLKTGKIQLKVYEPEKCEGRNCIIIDDLCDGGGTFNAIASQINPAHLTLMVTHGIFSQGFEKLEENFDEIITTSSYSDTYNSNIVKTIKWTFL